MIKSAAAKLRKQSNQTCSVINKLISKTEPLSTKVKVLTSLRMTANQTSTAYKMANILENMDLINDEFLQVEIINTVRMMGNTQAMMVLPYLHRLKSRNIVSKILNDEMVGLLSETIEWHESYKQASLMPQKPSNMKLKSDRQK